MRKVWVSLVATAFLAFTGSSLLAADDVKEADRVQNAGQVMTEILNVPDDIPQDILNKAYCVVVLPSVLKAAFIVGASYGRGVMTCRGGANFDGLWGAPTMMALEGGSVGFQIGGEATDFVLLLMSDRSAKGILTSKVKLGADASAAAGPKGRSSLTLRRTQPCARRFSVTREHVERLPGYRWRVRRCVPTTMPTRSCTGKKSMPKRLF